MALRTWAVTGGSGYVGRALATRLAAVKEDVRVLVRASRGEVPNSVVGDICDDHALARLVSGADVIVHLAAYVHRAARSRAEIAECERTNLEGTRRLVEAIATGAPDALLIFVSTVSVYAAADVPLTETSRYAPETVYGRTKLEAERLVLEANRAGRIRATILRPAMIFGPGAPGNLDRLAAMARRGVIVDIGGTGNRKSIMPIETTVDVILTVADHQEKANGEIFNVAGGLTLTMAGIASRIAAALGKRARVVRLPKAPIVFAARFIDRILSVLPLRVPSLSQVVSSYTSTVVLDDSKFRTTFGFTPQTTVTDAIDAMFRRA